MVWDMSSFNLSATFNIFRVLARPSSCLPHATVSTFNELPMPLSRAFEGLRKEKVSIRAVVLDKDDCFAKPKENEVFEPYKVSIFPYFNHLSNTAGAQEAFSLMLASETLKPTRIPYLLWFISLHESAEC
jgi:phosphatidylglycerophosphatase GEP4